MSEEIQISDHGFRRYMKRSNEARYNHEMTVIRAQFKKANKLKPLKPIKHLICSKFKDTEYFGYKNFVFVVRDETIVTVIPWLKTEFEREALTAHLKND